MIVTKRVYDPPAPGDGLRILVMRLWPRGVKKSAIDLWLRDLGAELSLLRAWKAGRLTWPALRRRYLAGLERPEARAALAALGGLARRRRVTILCACQDERRCHRGILRAVIGDRGGGRRHREPGAGTRPAGRERIDTQQSTRGGQSG